MHFASNLTLNSSHFSLTWDQIIKRGGSRSRDLNSGFHGEVTEKGGQVDPQPRAVSPRPAGEPLRGAKINGFEKQPDGSYRITFSWDQKTYVIHYRVSKDGTTTFEYIDPDGKVSTQKYFPRKSRGSNGE